MNARDRRRAITAALALAAGGAGAVEITVKNDSLTDFGAAVIVTGFTANEKAASWLTSPCAGNIRAVQVFWRSQSGATPPEFGERIEIFRAAPPSFPNPGSLAETILGPVMTDGVLNEFRFLDANQTVPLVVPVTAGETVAVSFAFDAAPPPVSGPSVVRDVDGCQAGRNTILAEVGPSLVWFSACALGVNGDWVIRAVVDCATGALTADLTISKDADATVLTPGTPITYTIVVGNAGPDPVSGVPVADAFPAAVANVTWSCSAGTGAVCGSVSGSGNISTTVNLVSGASATFVAQGIIAPGTSGSVANSASVAAPSGVTDPNLANNIDAAVVNVVAEDIFADGFEDP